MYVSHGHMCSAYKLGQIYQNTSKEAVLLSSILGDLKVKALKSIAAIMVLFDAVHCSLYL